MRSAHPILNNIIKGVIFIAFFLAGLIYGYSINLNTMQEQQNQICVLEKQTIDQQNHITVLETQGKAQQSQINELLRHKEEAETIKKILVEHENRLKNIEKRLK